MKKKQDLKSLTRNELINWFEKNEIQGFRAKQIFNWIYKNGAVSLNEMSNLPESLIERLENISCMTNLTLVQKKVADDGTIKYLWRLADGEDIESVYLPYYRDSRHTVCISSQVGCAMKCSFCATGISGLVRNLTTGEIIDQVLKIQQDISSEEFGDPGITNVVFMGMGEPLANLNSVLKAVDILNDEKALEIGMRKMTISTSGLVPEINRLAENNSQVGLAVSLSAPNNELRNKIMPINKKYPLEKLIPTIHSYIKKTGRRVTFEYVMMKNINDDFELAYQLIQLLKGLICHVNLIPVNPVTEFNIEKPSKKIVNKFRSILEKGGIPTTIREEKGSNIEAACGQLRHNNRSGGG